MTPLHGVMHRMGILGGIEVHRDEPLARHTSFGLGGPAHLWVAPPSVEAMCRVAGILGDTRWMIIGGGTNVLCDDKGFDGVVVSTRELRGFEVEGCHVRALAGTALTDVIRVSVEAGLCGIERLWGIPGTVGGAIAGNAGSFGAEAFDFLQRVTMVTTCGTLLTVDARDLPFGYRTGGIAPECVIVEALWELQRGEVQTMRVAMEDIRRRRAATQPWGHPTAGCVFRNPPGDSAGRLIDRAGLKGARVGGAVVSTLHANFIVLDGPACARDVRDLIRLVRDTVQRATGIFLELELKLVGGDG